MTSINERIAQDEERIRARWVAQERKEDRVYTAAELEKNLSEVVAEIRLIDTVLCGTEPVSSEDRALFAERMEYLSRALGILPRALEKARYMESESVKRGYHSMEVPSWVNLG